MSRDCRTVFSRDYEMPPGMRMQPRFRAWLDQTDGGTLSDYMWWITQHWADWRAETGATVNDHAAFDEWLSRGVEKNLDLGVAYH